MVFIQPAVGIKKADISSFLRRHRRQTEPTRSLIHNQTTAVLTRFLKTPFACVLLSVQRWKSAVIAWFCLYDSLPLLHLTGQACVHEGRLEQFTASSYLSASACSCCTGCLSSAVCPTT